MNKNDEEVYALSVKDLFSGSDYFEGALFYQDTNILNNIYQKAKPVKRGVCENDPTMKHVIPYVVLTSDKQRIFVTRRTQNQTEERLHGKASVGLGGHVGPYSNCSVAEAIAFGALRELNEELTGMRFFNFAKKIFELKLMGYVNWDQDDVGKVHFGLIYNIHVDSILSKGINIKETENMTGEWMSYKAAKKITNYETWSFCILESM